MQRVVAVLVVVGFAVSACSGDDSADSTTTVPRAATTTEPAPPDSTPPSTTAAPPPPTSAPTTTETPPDTTAPDTTAPPTTVDPLDDVAGSIQRDAQAGDDVLFDILTNPSVSDAEDRLRVYFVDDALESVLQTLSNFRRDDLMVQANPLVANTVRLTDTPRVIDGSDPVRVEVQTCRLDSAVVMAPLTGTDVRIAIDEEIYRTDAISSFILVDGIWQLQGGTTVSESTGDLSCD